MSIRARIQRVIEDMLPYYDPAEERAHRVRSAQQDEQVSAALVRNERVRAAYEAADRRLAQTYGRR